MDFSGFTSLAISISREIGLVYYVIASSERLSDALLNGKRYCTIMNEGVRLNVKLDDRAAAIALDYVDVDRQSDPASDRVLAGDVGADLPTSDRVPGWHRAI